MSDQTKQNLLPAKILEANPERLKSFLRNFGFANPLPKSEDFILLSEAIRNKRTETARVILEKMFGIDDKRQPRQRLHLTIDKSDDFNYSYNPEDSGHLKLLEILLDKGIHMNPLFGNHLLHIAVENDKMELVELLLNRGADVNVRNSEDMTPLHVATMKGFLTIAEKLLDKGANVNSTIYDLRRRNTKNCNNAGNTNKRIVKRLLKTENIVEEVRTPVQISSEDDVDFTYEKLKTIGNYDGSSIFFAVQNADVAMTKLLLGRGADVPNNPNVLNSVINSGNLDIIECFTKRDIDINGKGEEEETALHRAVLGPYSEDFKVEIIKLLLRRGASVHSRNKSEQTPLHLAAQKGYAKVVETLLEYDPDEHDFGHSEDTLSESSFGHGNDFSSKNKATQSDNKNTIDATELCVAVEKSDTKLVGIAPQFRRNEDNSKNSEDYSAPFSILRGSELSLRNKVAQLLAANNIGETALHMASSKNHQEVVEILLKHGIDIDCRTIFGKTALDVAFEHGCRQAFIVLLKYGSNIDVAYTADIPDRSRPSFCLIKSHRGEFIISNKYCVESITKHIMRMKTAGRFVSKGNLKCLAKNDETLNSYHQECDEEIGKLKEEKIGRNVSFYDVLQKSGNQLAVYARNERMIQALDSDDLRNRFPIYSDMISYNFKRGQVRELLIIISLNSFNSSVGYCLPPEVVITGIFGYLANEDLGNFIEACHTPTI